MPIILVRIDDRLIHGQVTSGWCIKLKPDIILVVSDEISCSDWQRDLCLASLPECFKGMVASLKDAPQIINELEKDSRPSYVLLKSPEDAYRVIKDGAHITEINVGGMHSAKGKREILEYMYVDEKDTFYLKALQEMGVKLDFRNLPENENADVMSKL